MCFSSKIAISLRSYCKKFIEPGSYICRGLTFLDGKRMAYAAISRQSEFVGGPAPEPEARQVIMLLLDNQEKLR